MSASLDEVKIIKVDENTPGGKTYHIRRKGSKDVKPTCFRQMKGDHTKRCMNVAGYRTGHPGQGACIYHGGLNADRVPPTLKTGKHATAMRSRLQEKIDAYLNEDRASLLDLTREAAATKAILEFVIEKFPETDADDFGTWVFRFNSIVQTLSTLVDRMAKIENRNTLNAAQVMYLRVVMVDMFMKYIADPDQRERAVRELASRMGGDKEITMLPSEIYTPNGDVL